jgi:toxin FitB
VIVLDTNVVSALMRPAPITAVAAWIRRQRVGTLLTTAITVAEIRFGLARLPAGQRSRRLQQAADEVLAAFPNQVLPFDVAAANLYDQIAAARE